MRRASDVRRSVGNRARICLGRSNQRRHALIGSCGGHRQEKRRVIEHRHRHEVLPRVVRQRLVERRIDGHVRVAHDQKLMAVGRGVFHRLDRDKPACSRLRVDDHRLRPRLRQLVRHDAREDRGSRAGGIRRRDLDDL